MSSVLKGNFKAKKDVEIKKKQDESSDEKFEREIMKHVGGSIAFVKKKKVDWGTKK